MTFRASLKLAVTLVALPVVLSQQLYPSQRVEIGNCPKLGSDSDIFGNKTAFSNQGLLPSLFITGDGTDPPTLKILRVHQLCEAIGSYRNTASSVAYLIEYEVPSDTTPRLAQVSLDCVLDTFNPTANYSFYPLPNPGATHQSDFNTAQNSLGTLVTDSSQIVSNFSTPPAYMCGQCGPLSGMFADQATRCVFCRSSCSQGMRRCLGRGNDQCCSWFLNDRCVQFCPSPLVGNPDTFDCGCSPLNVTGGTVAYSDDLLIGSVATFTCNGTNDSVLTAGSPANRTCTTSGWTGVEATCSGQCVEGSAQLLPLRTFVSNSRSSGNGGLFQICLNDAFGTVQLDSSTSFWSEKNTLVACRQLGFEGALNSIPTARVLSSNYASSSTPVHYRSVVCNGTESSIANCSTRLATTISHSMDVFLVCWTSGNTYTELHSNTTSTSSFTVGSIRLVGQTANGRGVVEILTEIGWSTICPNSAWTSSIATDICQSLGYETGVANRLSLSPHLVSPRLVQDPDCGSVRQTASLSRIDGGICTFPALTTRTCNIPEDEFAAVICSSSSSSESVRLFGLDYFSSTRLQGAVEYFIDGRWGVVCRPLSTNEVNEAICDGFGYARDESSVPTISSQQIRSVESRMKPLWISDMQCNSFDTRFSQCSISRQLGYGTCGSSRDILVVDCGPKNRPFNSGYIAAIVIPTLVVMGIAIFLGVKREEWLPQLKRHPFVRRLKEFFTCQCDCGNYSPPARRPVSTQQVQVITPEAAPIPAPATTQAPAPAPPQAFATEPSEPEPTLDNAELSKPPPPSYTTSFNLPNPKEDLPPPYSAHQASPSAPPPPQAYSIPQDNPAYPPGNSAYPPDASTPYPTTTPYPSGAEATPYPPGAEAVSPPGTALPYPTSLADQAYPPPPNVTSAYPPATYPQSENP